MTNKTIAMLMTWTFLAAFLIIDQAICLAQPADNTEINQRAGSPGELTADEQGQTKEDLAITQRIRLSIINEKTLSLYAHNVKIITKGGIVTLIGSVESIEEKNLIEKIATEVVQKENIQSELKIINS